jgi:hypothetical protein
VVIVVGVVSVLTPVITVLKLRGRPRQFVGGIDVVVVRDGQEPLNSW